MVRAAQQQVGNRDDDPPKALSLSHDGRVGVALTLVQSEKSEQERSKPVANLPLFKDSEYEYEPRALPKKRSALDDILASEAKRQRGSGTATHRFPTLVGKCWMVPGLMVKIMAKSIAGGKVS